MVSLTVLETPVLEGGEEGSEALILGPARKLALDRLIEGSEEGKLPTRQC